MDVGIIGSGSVGGALASGLSATGHDVAVGSRDPEATTVGTARVVSQYDAAAFGDVVGLARFRIDLSREYGRDTAFRYLRA